MVLHNYFTKQYFQTNVKQEEKRLWYTSLREEFGPISETMIQNHDTTWLSTWHDDDNGLSQLKQSSDTNLLSWQWMYRLCQASSISRYITTFFHYIFISSVSDWLTDKCVKPYQAAHYHHCTPQASPAFDATYIRKAIKNSSSCFSSDHKNRCD
jgi:hypothetical protein